KTIRHRARYGLSQIEQCRILTLTKILGLKQLGQADDLCAARRSLVNLVNRAFQVLVWVGSGGHLEQANFEFVRGQAVFSPSEYLEYQFPAARLRPGYW